MSRPNASQRATQTVRLLRTEGGAGVARRLLTRAVDRLPPPDVYRSVRIDPGDLLRAADLSADGWPTPAVRTRESDAPLTVAWVCVPGAPGSGGHTTIFRMVSALEQAGHRCIIYLRDDHGWPLDRHERTIRCAWPAVKAEIRDVAGGIEDADAIFATEWYTAYTVLASPATGVRLYFVQDFEPDFFPAGGVAMLAEATFRFGFHGITAGAWLAERLRRDYAMPCDHFDFGCDVDRYRLQGDAATRTGIAYYCRPSTPRRAHELAVMALAIFAARHPEVDIHLFPEPQKGLPFRTIDYGVLTPDQLSAVYNQCAAGLVLSATNVSLVPYEMLAAGCIPVVNDAEHNRVVLDNPEVVYAQATPFALADALSRLVSRSTSERAAAAKRASASVQSQSWDDAGRAVEQIVSELVEQRSLTAPHG